MPSQMMQLFRDPKELCDNYVKQIKQLLDFRSHHRSRLFKAQSEQFKKCSTMYKKLQAEYRKRADGEKAAINESLRCQEQLQSAKKKIEENERELARLRQMVQRAHHTTPSRHSGGSRDLCFSTPSQHGDAAFVGVCTSTPINERGSKPHRVPTGSIFGAGDGLSPIVSSDYLTTPAMLGIGRYISCITFVPLYRA
uniref:Uncharacterized protein n=1 Tax=Steinernema glaseri TaxID=37863 RepID=A0A1I7YX52_9BILA